MALYLEDTISLKNWTVRIGIRGDFYNGIAAAQRGGAAGRGVVPDQGDNTVLQTSYARTMETPFNENLVLSSEGCNDPVVNDIMATIQSYPCLTAPLRPGWRNEYHVGLQQAFGQVPGGRAASISGSTRTGRTISACSPIRR